MDFIRCSVTISQSLGASICQGLAGINTGYIIGTWMSWGQGHFLCTKLDMSAPEQKHGQSPSGYAFRTALPLAWFLVQCNPPPLKARCK